MSAAPAPLITPSFPLGAFPDVVTGAALKARTSRAFESAGTDQSPENSPAFDPRSDELLPLPPSLSALLPEGGLKRGRTLQVTGSTALLLALLGTVSSDGGWCAAIGMPTLGLLAATARGVDLARFALVPDPGDRWASVTSALLDAVDVVVIAPDRTTPGAMARRLTARARERRAVLLVAGEWECADAAFAVTDSRWTGLGQGHGHLQHHTLEVRASGRRVGGRSRTASLALAPSAALSP